MGVGGGPGVRITSRTIERLTEVIMGSPERSPYRTGRALVEFFRDFGERDLYAHESFPGRANYVREKLRKFNGTQTLERIVSSAFDFVGEDGFDAEEQAGEFNRYLVRDGYRLALEYRVTRMEGNKRVEADPYFEVQSLSTSPVVPEGLAAISHAGVTEQVSKANARLALVVLVALTGARGTEVPRWRPTLRTGLSGLTQLEVLAGKEERGAEHERSADPVDVPERLRPEPGRSDRRERAPGEEPEAARRSAEARSRQGRRRQST